MQKEAVVGIVSLDDFILIALKKFKLKSFLSGKWHIPGETIKKGESDEEALTRGMKDKAGIDIKVVEYLAKHQTPKHTEVRWYECQLLDANDRTKIKAGSDLESVMWIPRVTVPNYCGKKATSMWPAKLKDYFSEK